MHNIPRILLLLLSSILLVTCQEGLPTKPTFLSQNCGTPSDRFWTDIGGIYFSNIKAVLVTLQNRALAAFPYYYSSAGVGLNQVYGKYYCREDISSDLCSQCIQSASTIARDGDCSGAKLNTVWFYECTLRYGNLSVTGAGNIAPLTSDWSLRNVSDPVRFGSVLRTTMDGIINKAVNNSIRFATGEGVVSPTETVYCLVQCSPDLNATLCSKCLQINSLVLTVFFNLGEYWPQTMYVFTANCHTRYSNQGIFYYKLDNAPPPATSNPPPPPVVPVKGKSSIVVKAVIPVVVVGALLIIIALAFCLIRRKTSSSQTQTVNKPTTEPAEVHVGAAESTECLQFGLKTIETATNNFSIDSKLGQGGFGIVYQGILENGQEIAVKRLSKNSGQGTEEFKTEVAVVAKLQHKNLVRLVGCCVDGEERLLVYEFLCNLSLDRFLFDQARSAFLTWEIRHKIILGIARGLHYLHEDSRVKIVHRDLKTSNILLDDILEPKIADFGMARLVMVDQTAGNTARVVGTYGYMAPEYALAGRYSTKSDVYSFGVIVLEILSGKSNNRFYEITHGEGLLSHAWRVWNEGTIEQLIDPILTNNFSRNEAERCLQLALLCVQDDEANRPTMHAVLVMLNSNTMDLPPPSSLSHSSYIHKLPEIESDRSSGAMSTRMSIYPR